MVRFWLEFVAPGLESLWYHPPQSLSIPQWSNKHVIEPMAPIAEFQDITLMKSVSISIGKGDIER